MCKYIFALFLALTAVTAQAQDVGDLPFDTTADIDTTANIDTSADATQPQEIETTAIQTAPPTRATPALPAPSPVATTAPAPAPAPQTSNVQSPDQVPYTVNPGDTIEVYVWGEERLQREINVLPDGTFSFPLVGRVYAQGKLPGQIEDVISKGLESQYRGQVPQVTVSVRSPSGMQFSVMGRVNSPGSFTPGRYINLLEALSMAGGPSEFADLDSISIIRKTPQGLTTIGARMQGIFKSSGAAKAVARGEVPKIESGDTIIVP